MVAGVELAEGRAQIGVQLTTPACPSKDVIAASVRDAVGKVPGVTAVEVRFSAQVRGRPNRPDNPRLPGVKNIIAVAAGKGGVGKSTVSTNLAAALARQGATVGILDADVYGPSIPQMMGEPETPSSVETGNKIVPAVHHGLRVVSIGFFVERGGAVIWRGPMVHKLLQQFIEDVQWGELDYLVVDLPPGTGDAQLSLSQLLPITGAVMVSTPQEVSVIDVEKALAMWQRVEVPVAGPDRKHERLRLPELRPPRRDLPARRRPEAGRAVRHQVPGRNPPAKRGQHRRRPGHPRRDPRPPVARRRNLHDPRPRRRLRPVRQEQRPQEAARRTLAAPSHRHPPGTQTWRPSLNSQWPRAQAWPRRSCSQWPGIQT